MPKKKRGGKFDYKSSTHPNDDFLRRMRNNRMRRLSAMRLQRDNQVKIPLVGVGLSFLPHVVACRFWEVESTHRDFGHLVRLQVNSEYKMNQHF